MHVFINRGRRLVYAGVGASVLAMGLAGFPAGATQGQSQLLISSSTDFTTATATLPEIDLSSDPLSLTHTATVYTQLDASCPNVFVDPAGHGQQYGILTSFNPVQNNVTPPAVIADVNPTSVSGKTCTDTTSFVVKGDAPGSTTLSFTPMAKNRGLQRKLSDTAASVVIVVDGGVTDFCVANPNDPTCLPSTTDRPAAPAVANMLIDGTLDGAPDVATECKSHFNNAKSWRGSTISNVALIMPKPENEKDNLTLYPTFADWENKVLDLLSATCGPPAFAHVPTT